MAQNPRNRSKAPQKRRTQGKPQGSSGGSGDNSVWIWGSHAALAALNNPQREILDLYLTRNSAAEGFAAFAERAQIVDPKALNALLPDGAVHQGVAIRTKHTAGVSLEDLISPAEGLIVMLDGVTDPRNAGAIYRSAAAFGAKGIIMQDRKAPPLSGGLAKTAVGAAESVPTARVVNLARTLNELTKRGWRAIGLAGEAEMTLSDAMRGGDATVLVLGAEEKGLRPSVAEACDAVARIPMSDKIESLNVSVAASVALYEWARGQ